MRKQIVDARKQFVYSLPVVEIDNEKKGHTMNCLNCENENDRDYDLCPTCATTRHFTDRECRCHACEREVLAQIAWDEELKLNYGWPIQAAA